MHVNPIQHAYVFVLMLCIVAASLSGCVSQNTDPQVLPRPTVVEEIALSLEQTSREYELALEEGDAISMAQAGLDRIEIAKRWFDQDEAGLFIENSIAMIHRARRVASHNEDTSQILENLLADADIGPETNNANFGHLFGNTGNALKRSRATALAVRGRSERVVQLRVEDDIGVVVLIEAPAYHGVSLELVDDTGTVRCHDTSDHGDLICRFRPRAPGLVAASIINPSALEVSVLMITNHSIEREAVGAATGAAHP